MLSFALLLHGATTNWNEWVFYPSFMVGWMLLGGAYLIFAGPLRHHFRGSSPVPPLKLASFVFGLLLMLVSLQGPLHELSDNFLFSAHMAQHLLVMLVLPPFLLYGTPDWMLRPVLRIPGMMRFARWLTLPLVAFALNNVIFGAWHFPGPYDLMMRDHNVHILMHLMIMVTGVMMWWPVLSPLPELPRLAPPLQMLYLFVLGIPMMIVAAMITFSGTALYTWYAQAPRVFGLSLLDDQRLGGVLMWVPGGAVLWIAITMIYFRWAGSDEKKEAARLAGEQAGKQAASPGLPITPPPFPER